MGSVLERESRGHECGLYLGGRVNRGEGVDTGEGVNGVCTAEREWTQKRV